METKYYIKNRFWSKVKKGKGCWEWQAGIDMRGYGRFQLLGKWLMAHRISWELLKGKIPKGLCICHKCDNTKCVRPSHLFLGTQMDNMKDKIKKGRLAWGEKSKKSHLKNKDIQKIRRLYSTGKFTYFDLEKIFNIHYSTVGRIINIKTWKYL